MEPWRGTLPMCRSWIRDSGRDNKDYTYQDSPYPTTYLVSNISPWISSSKPITKKRAHKLIFKKTV